MILDKEDSIHNMAIHALQKCFEDTCQKRLVLSISNLSRYFLRFKAETFLYKDHVLRQWELGYRR
jgi:hypothetical protein